jgi:hypothetical protein
MHHARSIRHKIVYDALQVGNIVLPTALSEHDKNRFALCFGHLGVWLTSVIVVHVITEVSQGLPTLKIEAASWFPEVKPLELEATTYLHLVRRLGMRGAVPPLTHTS